MKRVTLRFKKPNGLKTYLFLDYYPPILDPKTNKRKRQEYLGMYIYILVLKMITSANIIRR